MVYIKTCQKITELLDSFIGHYTSDELTTQLYNDCQKMINKIKKEGVQIKNV